MRHHQDFDVEAALRTLEAVARSASAEQQPTVELVANALHYLYVTNQLGALFQYVREAAQPAALTARIQHAFPDMAEATRWLHTSPPPEQGTLVKVAGRTHAVWRDDDGRQVLVPSLSPEELEAREK